MGLKRVGVIQLVDRIDAQTGRDAANADLERRNAERLANLLVRVAQLFDQLRIGRLERECCELHVGADHRDLAGVVAAEIRVPVRLDGVGVSLGHARRRSQYAAGVRAIAEERGRILEDLEVLAGGHIRRAQGRDADQRMMERVQPVVDNLARRHHQFIARIFLRQQVRGRREIEPVVNVPAIGHQRDNVARVKDIQAGDNATVVAPLQRVGVALNQLRQNPRLAELLLRLVVVRLPQYGAIRRVLYRLPDAVAVHRLQLERQLADVLRDAIEAGVQGRIAEDGRLLFLDVLLPCAGIRFQNPTPAAAIVGNGRKLLRAPDFPTENLHLLCLRRTTGTQARRAIGLVAVGRGLQHAGFVSVSARVTVWRSYMTEVRRFRLDDPHKPLLH